MTVIYITFESHDIDLLYVRSLAGHVSDIGGLLSIGRQNVLFEPS